jgi:mannose-1-phosphate guanylyltransferase
VTPTTRNDALFAVILAGGRGERFWPYSRRSRPKQFLPLLGDRTLLEETMDRLAGLVPADRILLLTSEDLAAGSREVLRPLPASGVYGEPFARDTAAAVLYGAVRARRADPNAVCLVFPADHVIRPIHSFHADLTVAIGLANEGALVTIGVPPARAETGYGYVEAGDPWPGLPTAFRVRAFHEKPDAARAQGYAVSGRHFWNAGMFAWRADAIVAAAREAMPEMSPALDRLIADWVGDDGGAAARAFYEGAPAISVDYGILEKARTLAVVRATFEWDDVGTWPAVQRIRETDDDGNAVIGHVIARDTTDCVLVAEDGLLATLGVSGLVVVRTRDVTMVAPADRAQEVRTLVAAVREKGLSGYE